MPEFLPRNIFLAELARAEIAFAVFRSAPSPAARLLPLVFIAFFVAALKPKSPARALAPRLPVPFSEAETPAPPETVARPPPSPDTLRAADGSAPASLSLALSPAMPANKIARFASIGFASPLL